METTMDILKTKKKIATLEISYNRDKRSMSILVKELHKKLIFTVIDHRIIVEDIDGFVKEYRRGSGGPDWEKLQFSVNDFFKKKVLPYEDNHKDTWVEELFVANWAQNGRRMRMRSEEFQLEQRMRECEKRQVQDGGRVLELKSKVCLLYRMKLNEKEFEEKMFKALNTALDIMLCDSSPDPELPPLPEEATALFSKFHEIADDLWRRRRYGKKPYRKSLGYKLPVYFKA